MSSRTWILLAVLAGIAFMIVAIIYWAEPASSLPSFFPGQQAGDSEHHIKHGIAAFVVGLGCFIFAWFKSGPREQKSTNA